MTINIGCSGFVLFVVFLVLKLTKVIAWSWLYVTMPLWIVPAVGICFLAIVFVVWLIATVCS
jgi:hypothetical protein